MKLKNILTAAFVLFAITVNAKTVKVDTKNSNIEWIGKKIGGQHNGAIQLKEGVLKFKNGNIQSGEFVVDMNTITNTDLDSKTYQDKLVGHLKSDDFFGVAKYPEAKLHIISSTPFNNNETTVTGNITIKGETEKITFKVKRSNNIYTASLEVDRSHFNVRYGSNSFFDNLGNKAIDNIFTLNIKLITE
ncbi:YceI family protein [Halosquirtibacter laminarini]|uniref:YceI family protein n=1 Tax=Halosquirtibacter laminarini TaxID=3374600 RepID=A0AC61NKD7_9BACT|nr:YceI family protein [Prolixibacteraceae bacterium]